MEYGNMLYKLYDKDLLHISKLYEYSSEPKKNDVFYCGDETFYRIIMKTKMKNRDATIYKCEWYNRSSDDDTVSSYIGICHIFRFGNDYGSVENGQKVNLL
jgi:hypothetical protein